MDCNGRVKIDYVTPGSGAAEKGIRRGNRILKVEGKNVGIDVISNPGFGSVDAQLAIDTVTRLLNGRPGTQVKLDIQLSKFSQKTYSVTRK